MLGFSHPWMLAAALAAAIPIALHLMRREVVRNLVFPSLRFILKGRVPQGGKRQLRDIPLLLLRLLALLAAVALFARPFLRLERPPAAASGSSLRVVLLDLSASLSTNGRFERAVAAIRERLTADADDRWAWLASGNGIVDQLPPGSAGALRERLEQSQPRLVAGQHLPALTAAAELLRQAGGGTLLIVSDFQASDWPVDGLPVLPAGVELELVDIGGELAGNLGIVEAKARRLGDEQTRVMAEIVNFGAEPAEREVTLVGGGGGRLSQTVRVAPGRSAEAVFVLPAGGSDIGAVSLSPDAYAADDTRHLWLGQPPPAKLLAVLPVDEEPAKNTELFFLRNALSAVATGADRGYDIQVAGTSTFFALQLDRLDGLLLLGAAAYFDDVAFARVKAFVEGGGVVLCTPSETALARQFLNLQRQGLLAARFVELVGGERGETRDALGWVEPDSGIGRLFADANSSDLFLFPIRKLMRLEAWPPARPLLKTEAGHPFLLRQEVGDGVFLALTVPLLSQWSDLPVAAAFLPLVREVLAEAGLGGRPGVVRLACGEPLPVWRTLTGAPPAAVAIDTLVPGVQLVGDLPVEINVPISESSLERRSPASLRRALLPAPTEAPATLDTPPDRRDLWLLAAAALALFLLLEAALAARHDRREQA